jgi:zinc protease
MHSNPLRIALYCLVLGTSALLPAWSQQAQAAPGAAASAQAAALQFVPQFVRELGGIREYTLPNGLQLLLLPDETQTTTTLSITYRVGSRHEAPGEYGMAHLLEHMLFKGTAKVTDIPGEFARRAMRSNATTSVDRTNYFSSFNANDDTLAFALGLEADRMVSSRVAKEDLDREMTVVRNEFEMSDSNGGQVLGQRVRAAAYQWHAYGRSTIGIRSDIEGVPIEKLQAFYKRHYRPDNATVMVAGRFDTARVLALVAQQFGPLARPAEPLPLTYTTEPPQDGERSVVVRRVGGQPMVMAHYHVPAFAHPDTAALQVYGLMMSVPPSGLLFKGLVESKLAVGAFMGGQGGADPGGVMAIAVLSPGADAVAAETRLLALAEGSDSPPLLEADVARIREFAVQASRNAMKSPEGLSMQISNLLGAGDWRLFFQLLEDLPKVTLADVERVRRAYFRPANRTLGRYEPATAVERVEIPAAPPLAQRLAALKGPAPIEAAEVFNPTPAALAARTRTQRLPSGLELITLPKQTKGNSVVLQMQLRWGERATQYARRGGFLVSWLMFDGSTTRTRQQVQDELLRLKASANITGGDQGASISLSAERDTLIPALKLLADVLQNPRLPPDAFERERQRSLAGLRGSRNEPETLRNEAVRGHYNSQRGVKLGDPDFALGVDDRIRHLEATTLEEVRSFYADCWSANDARVSVAGAVPEGLEAAIEQAFGPWKKPKAPAFVRHVPVFKPVAPARFDAQAPDRANAVLRMHRPFAASQQSADFQALVLAMHILGDGPLDSRLARRVRQKEGLSYSVGASLNVPFRGDAADFAIFASFAPDQRERIVQVVQEELTRFADEGVTQAELDTARREILERRQQRLSSDAALGGALLQQADQGETWASLQQRNDQLMAVTPAQVQQAWRKYLGGAGFVVSTAGDFKSAVDRKP